MSSAPALACTSSELLYLASLRGGTAIVGISDPLRGRSPEEVEAALMSARDSLAERRFLAVEADGTIALDFDVARVVDAVAKPRRSFFAYQVVASAADAIEAGMRRVFHVRGSLTVEIVSDSTESVELVPLAGREGIADAVLAFWAVDDQAAVDGDPTVVPRQAMHSAARVAATDGAAAAEEQLLRSRADPRAARALATTLAHPRRNAALLAFETSGPPGRTLGMGMLEGDNGLWRLRPMSRDGVALVEVEPCSGPALATIIRGFVTSVS